jgi:DNA transformation protein and related proteins
MTPDDLIDLFAEFGPVTIKKMFSGHGISVDGVNFAMSLKSGMIFRVDDLTMHRYEAEGAEPFSYSTSKKTVVVKSYRHLPERLHDDPEELAVWAREALDAARRAKLKKSGRAKNARPGSAKAVRQAVHKSTAASSKNKNAPKTKSAGKAASKSKPASKKAAPKRGPKAVKSVRR